MSKPWVHVAITLLFAAVLFIGVTSLLMYS